MAKKKAATKKTAAKKSSGKGGGDVLIVGSKVKAAVKGRGFRTSGDALEGLNGWVHWLIDQATKRAKQNGRQTVRNHDFIVM